MWSISSAPARATVYAGVGLLALACGRSHDPPPDGGFIVRDVCSDVRVEVPPESCTFEEGRVIPDEITNPVEGAEALRGCQYFHGSINLQDTQITDVAFAESLVVVDGRINLFRNREMVSLHGLHNLQSVDDLTIRLAYSLESLAELRSLRVVHGGLGVSGNSALDRLDGLEQLVCVGGLMLHLRESVTSIEPLAGLQRVEGDVWILAPGIPRDELDAWLASVDVTGGIEINGEVVREAP